MGEHEDWLRDFRDDDGDEMLGETMRGHHGQECASLALAMFTDLDRAHLKRLMGDDE